MAPSKVKEEPEPSPEPEPPDDDEEQAWAKATPRLKALMKETFGELLDEIAASTPDDDDSEPEPELEPKPVKKPAVAAVVVNKRTRQSIAARPSGGSILDILIGR